MFSFPILGKGLYISKTFFIFIFLKKKKLNKEKPSNYKIYSSVYYARLKETNLIKASIKIFHLPKPWPQLLIIIDERYLALPRAYSGKPLLKKKMESSITVSKAVKKKRKKMQKKNLFWQEKKRKKMLEIQM